MVNSFEDLKIWQLAHKLMLEVYEIPGKFPKEETYTLISQLRKSALSVSANIAESQGRFHFADSLHFILMARGSLEETRSHLMAAKDLGYLTENDFDKLNKNYIALRKAVNGFIRRLRDNLSNPH